MAHMSLLKLPVGGASLKGDGRRRGVLSSPYPRAP